MYILFFHGEKCKVVDKKFHQRFSFFSLEVDWAFLYIYGNFEAAKIHAMRTICKYIYNVI